MKQIILVLILLGLLHNSSFGQHELPKAKVYLSDGKVVEGYLKQNKPGKTHIKILSGTKTKKIKKRKIDSLFIDTDKYIVEKTTFTGILLKEVVKGELSIYEFYDQHLYIKRNNTELLFVPRNTYERVLYLFCNHPPNSEQKIDKTEFIKLIRECNLSQTDTEIPYDSVKHVSNILISRISFYRPEAGMELRLGKSISLFGSAAVNFGGDTFRKAKTYVNYDYGSELRIYFNQKKRINKGKSNYNLSGPFIAGTYRMMIDIDRENQNIYGFVFGWQENSLFKNGYANFKLGSGISPEHESFYILSSINLGWNINIIRAKKK